MEGAVFLLADRPSPWRDAVTDALSRDEGSAVDVTDDGEALLEALVERPATRAAILVGDELQRIGGLEALYLASRRLGAGKKSADKSAATVILITTVRADVEWLDLMRKRGVDSFVYRDDPVDATVALVGRAPGRERRVHPRSPIAIGVELVFDDAGEVTGLLENVSLNGMLLTISGRELKKRTFPAGMSLRLTFVPDDLSSPVSCRAEVRSVTLRKRLLGDRLVLGLRLVDLDEPTSRQVQRLCEGATSPSTASF